LEALKLEEAYHEEVMNRTCSLEALSTRTIIDATRLLTDELQINKAKAKALITLAKEVLVPLFLRDRCQLSIFYNMLISAECILPRRRL
jgi:hypothetical protein